MKKRKHHYVWRHYLRGWGEGSQIWCKHEDQLFQSNVENLAQQRDFYKLNKLSEEDINFIRLFAIDMSPPGLRERHEYWIRLFTGVHERQKIGSQLGITDPEFSKLIDEFEHNLEEDLHASIESAGMPCLDSMRKGDLSFYEDDEVCISLMHYLSTQYFRTNCMKQRMMSISSKLPIRNIETVWNVMSHIYATNLGANLYQNRKRFRPVFLQNSSSVNLITGDQPLINVHKTASGAELVQPTHFELYYPLGPDKAFLLHDLSDESSEVKNTLSESDVQNYNSSIANNAHSQLYGSTSNDLIPHRALGLKV